MKLPVWHGERAGPSFCGELVERPLDQSGRQGVESWPPVALTEEWVDYRRMVDAQSAQMLACRQQPLGNGEREPEYDARAAP